MTKEEYIKITKERLDDRYSKIMIDQIEKYYEAKEYSLDKCKYNIGDTVKLDKGTLLHGTYKNIEGLQEIVKDGLISSWFLDSNTSKYPSSVGVWNLKEEYLLKDYINFYSGGTILYSGIIENNEKTSKSKTKVIPLDELSNIVKISNKENCHMWTIEQTKEARFMPNPLNDRVQIGIIFDGNNKYTKELLKGDILNPDFMSDEDVKDFVNEKYYERFIIDRQNKNDLFTDRESAILFGLPSSLIEGILVGRIYEKDKNILKEIKELLPNCYISNLDGKVIA